MPEGQRNMTWTISKILTISSLVLLYACGGGNEGVTGTGQTDQIGISGAAQKGPFILGTTILVNELTDKGKETNKTIITQTDDNLGNFSFSLDESKILQLVASGYHFNEITGKLSNSTLDLRAIYNANESKDQKAYINIMTHTIHKRVLALLENGIDINKAITDAQSELINTLNDVFPISNELTDFTQLNLFNDKGNDSLGNAYLLAMSASFYQAAFKKAESSESVDAELSLMLNNFALDLADDGKISDANIVLDLIAASREIEIKNVESNLVNRAKSVLDEEIEVADMNLVLDSDGDGTLNSEDEDADGDGIADSEQIGLFNKVIAEGDTYIINVIETKNSEFIALGFELFDQGYSFREEPFLMFLDENGYVKDKKDLAIEAEELFSVRDFVIDENDNLIVFGNRNYMDGSGKSDIVVMNFDSKMNMAWKYTIENSLSSVTGQKIRKVDDGYIITTRFPSRTDLLEDRSPYLIKLNESGEKVWDLLLDKSIENFVSIADIHINSGKIHLVGAVMETLEFNSYEEASSAGYWNVDIVEVDGEEVYVGINYTTYMATMNENGEDFEFSSFPIKIRNPNGMFAAVLDDNSTIIKIENPENENLLRISANHELLWAKLDTSTQYSGNIPLALPGNHFAFVHIPYNENMQEGDYRGYVFNEYDIDGNTISDPVRISIKPESAFPDSTIDTFSYIENVSLTSDNKLFILALFDGPNGAVRFIQKENYQ